MLILIAKDVTEETGLHFASQYGRLSTAQCLVGRGASLNRQDDSGWTPLHYASRFGDALIVSLLPSKNEAGAKIKAKHGEPTTNVAGTGFESGEEMKKEIKTLYHF